jgi:hypothetical protein
MACFAVQCDSVARHFSVVCGYPPGLTSLIRIAKSCRRCAPATEDVLYTEIRTTQGAACAPWSADPYRPNPIAPTHPWDAPYVTAVTLVPPPSFHAKRPLLRPPRPPLRPAQVWGTLAAMPLRLLERVLPWVTRRLSDAGTAELLVNVRLGAPHPDSVGGRKGWFRGWGLC